VPIQHKSLFYLLDLFSQHCIYIDNGVSNKYNSIVDKEGCLSPPHIGFFVSFTQMMGLPCCIYSHTRCIFLSKIQKEFDKKWVVCHNFYISIGNIFNPICSFWYFVFIIDQKIFLFDVLLVQCFDRVVRCNSIDFCISIVSTYPIYPGC